MCFLPEVLRAEQTLACQAPERQKVLALAVEAWGPDPKHAPGRVASRGHAGSVVSRNVCHVVQ